MSYSAEKGLSFFLRSLKYSEGVLVATVGNAREDHAEITFNYVRTYALLRESDFFKEFAQYETACLIPAAEPKLGVFKILRGALLQSVLEGRLNPEDPQYFWISTPDECLEVVGFEEPTLKVLVKH